MKCLVCGSDISSNRLICDTCLAIEVASSSTKIIEANLKPRTGPKAGGTLCTISGITIGATPIVRVGNKVAAIRSRDSVGGLTVSIPPGNQGEAPVELVHEVGGRRRFVPCGTYTYVGETAVPPEVPRDQPTAIRSVEADLAPVPVVNEPRVDSIEPMEVDVASIGRGLAQCTLHGSNFVKAPVIWVGGKVAERTSLKSSSEITFFLPKNIPGKHKVVIHFPKSDRLQNVIVAYVSNAIAKQEVHLPTRKESGSCRGWFGLGDTVELDGVAIHNPALYVGNSLPAVSGYKLEPALVRPSGAARAATLKDSPPPIFESLTPNSQTDFVKWVTNQCEDWWTSAPHIQIMLYGIERRVLADSIQHPMGIPEIEYLATRIRNVYLSRLTYLDSSGESTAALLDLYKYLRMLEEHGKQELTLVPRNLQDQPGPVGAILDIGQVECAVAVSKLAELKRPISAEWAYQWFVTRRSFRYRFSNIDHPDFKSAFIEKTNQWHPNGIEVRNPGNKRYYSPVSPSFAPGSSFAYQFRDVYEDPDAIFDLTLIGESAASQGIQADTHTTKHSVRRRNQPAASMSDSVKAARAFNLNEERFSEARKSLEKLSSLLNETREDSDVDERLSLAEPHVAPVNRILPPRPLQSRPLHRAFSLDEEKITTARQSTETVSGLLHEVFAPESEAQVGSERESNLETSDRIAGLLRELLGTAPVGKAEFVLACQRLNLMPNGAADSINELAYETLGEPVIDLADDPVLYESAARAVIELLEGGT